jgi:hypothetical protein
MKRHSNPCLETNVISKRGRVWAELSDSKQTTFTKLLKRGRTEKVNVTQENPAKKLDKKKSLEKMFQEVTVEPKLEIKDDPETKMKQELFMQLLENLLTCAPIAEHFLWKTLDATMINFSMAETSSDLKFVVQTNITKLEQSTKQLDKVVGALSRMSNMMKNTLDVSREIEFALLSP